MSNAEKKEKTANYQFKTPMMRQYIQIKKEYPKCLLFFRLGDFYELFLEDAEIGSKILDITLTARHKGQDGKIPMCGVPYHAIDSYLGKVIKAGYQAAICEQVSKPEKGKNIVDREVIRIITPGTIVNENILDNKSHNFLLTLNFNNNEIVLAYVDVSTGHFFISEVNTKNKSSIIEQIVNEIKRLRPNEIILNQNSYSDYKLLKALKNTGQLNIFTHDEKDLKHMEMLDNLRKFFKVPSLKVFDVDENNELTIKTTNFLISYLLYTQKENIHHIRKISCEDRNLHVRLDAETIRNLELFESNQASGFVKNKNLSLFSILDNTKTSMGGRKLKEWILYPLIQKAEIEKRLNSVEFLLKNTKIKNEISELLKGILDIERLLSKLGTRTANGRDLIGLKESLKVSKELSDIVFSNQMLEKSIISEQATREAFKRTQKVISIIEKTIKDDPPASVREGKIIKKGVNEELDDIIDSIKESREWISNLESIEREKTGISNLKVGFNSVFGYYIEISKSNIPLVPSNYIRKQTLVNAERFITEELKYKEEIVLNAEEKINELEFDIFIKTIEKILQYSKEIQTVATFIAKTDVIFSLAETSIKNNYIKPKILDKKQYDINLTEARHPTVERALDVGSFTPNNTNLTKKKFIHLITGPNMAGKSTYIRQVALIQLMAQIGSYIPAEKAEMSIVDGIYTRIGAGDALAEGLSTFMVEMIETARILNNATPYSLIILDEVGRGTSTVDGLSIARAVVEYIHKKIKSKTLFATHFHELININQRLKGIENYRIQVLEEKNKIKFLHKLEKGGTNKSYGVEVAKLAGIPEEVVNRAKEILEKETSNQLKLDL